MKKIFYLFAITAFVFTSCEPLEDVNAEVDALTANDMLVDDLVFTLTDENYETLDLSFGNFSSEDDAKSALPGFLSDTYPQLGVIYNADGSIAQSSSALITYKLFSPIKFDSYTVTDADYEALAVESLNDSGDFNDFFGYKFPSEAKGTVIDLTYNSEPAIEDYTLNDDDYDFVGNGRFDNFDIRAGRDEESIESRRLKIQTILLNNFPDADFGDKFKVTYEVFDGSSADLEMEVILTDNAPDPAKTTNYTLTEDDFDSVGNGNFDNFDIRQGSAEETIEVRRGKIETILLNNFPAAVDGDIYNVTYAVWVPGDEVRTMLVVKNGSNYDLFSAKTYDLYTFALEEATMRFTLANEWAAPITFTADEYALMGQRFPNFSDIDEAVYKIGIYLRTLYPFASPDDFVPVQYDYFNSGVSQRNVNYVFDGAVWNAIPNVIDTELKLAHNGITWVPDNTIKYTLTQADYDLVGNGNFANFDVRDGRDEFELSVRFEKINTILLNNFPQYGEGQKFTVSYNVWEPGDNVYTMNLIHNGTRYDLQ